MILQEKINMCLQCIEKIDFLIKDLDMTTGYSVETLMDLKQLRYYYEKRLLELNLILVNKQEIEEFTPPHLVQDDRYWQDMNDDDNSLKFSKRITKNQK